MLAGVTYEYMSETVPTPGQKPEVNYQDYGRIEGNDLDGYQVYGLPVGEADEPVHLNIEPVEDRSMAEKILRDYVDEAVLPFET